MGTVIGNFATRFRWNKNHECRGNFLRSSKGGGDKEIGSGCKMKFNEGAKEGENFQNKNSIENPT